MDAERDGSRTAMAQHDQHVAEGDQGRSEHEPGLGPRADEGQQGQADDAEADVPHALDGQVGAVAVGLGGHPVPGCRRIALLVDRFTV